MPQVTQLFQNHIKTKSSPDMVTAGVAEAGAGEGGVAGLDPKYFVAATPGGTHYRYRFECHQKQFLTFKALVLLVHNTFEGAFLEYCKNSVDTFTLGTRYLNTCPPT